MITIRTNSDAVVIALSDYGSQIDRAIVRAMNRAAASGRTVETREIARDMKLPAKTVRDKIVMQEATRYRPVASISAPLKRIPLGEFGARGPEPSRGRGRGVSYNAGGGRRTIPDAFIATLRSGHRGVFIRAGAGARKSPGAWSKNLPIRQLFGPSLGWVFNKYRALAIRRMEETFVRNFEHELVFAGVSRPPMPTEDSGGTA